MRTQVNSFEGAPSKTPDRASCSTPSLAALQTSFLYLLVCAISSFRLHHAGVEARCRDGVVVPEDSIYKMSFIAEITG